jgi:hypothetical protein
MVNVEGSLSSTKGSAMFTDPSLGTDFLVNVAVALVAGGVCLSPLGTKIKDFFKGIPSDVRTALNDVEADAVSKVKAAAAAAKAPVKKPASAAAALVAASAATVAATPAAAPNPAPAPAPAPQS